LLCFSFAELDLGFKQTMADMIRDRFTKSITGGNKKPMDPTSRPAAYDEIYSDKEGV